MLKVYACIAEQHDHRLVLLAGIICILASVLAVLVARRASALRREQRPQWIALAGLASGLGIWSTHFIAMIAYEPQLPVGYDVPLTLLSIAAAVAMSGLAWWLELRTRRRSLSPLPALVLAAGIATMHYLGMAALRVQGHVLWDGQLVFASLAAGAALAWAALIAHRRLRRGSVATAALLFALAICGLHFIAMAAASILPDPRIAMPADAIRSDTLAILVGAGAFMLILVGGMYLWFDHRLALRRIAEQQRVTDFANAAIEGLAVIEGSRIVDVNAALRTLAGWPHAAVAPLAVTLPALADSQSLTQLIESGQTREMILRAGDGDMIDVEVTARPIAWRGRPHTVLVVTDIRARKEAEQRIHHLAYHDPLTGIANRSLFNTRVAEAAATRGPGDEIAVFCFDLDRFKSINDLYGHSVGDELLRHVANELKQVSTTGMLPARLGGDEFAMMCRMRELDMDAASIARRILARLNRPVTIGNQMLRISASLGIAMIPGDATEADVALRHADLALYRAKADGRGIFRFFEPAMDAMARDRAALEADLRRAIAEDSLHIDYQPLVGIEAGRVEGFEALVRWNHPERGLMMPDDFIPIAEDSGLIIELGEWVLRKACTDAARWDPPLKLSVNLSPAQFAYADICETVARALADAGLPPKRLELEITEGVFVQDAERGIAILSRLRETGVQIAMDDFGTGYSSLSYFRQFPFDKVKIDRSFIADMLHNGQARSIVEAIISLGRGLNLEVVAEGVETEEQLDQLRQQGCTQVQGYLISEPRPIGQFAGSVLSDPAWTAERRAQSRQA
ncbi:EAL domain-containing protein [Sphingomonas colocasiae]|uniref:EAL domain-containing protein n=1 Tax=Sphingomonas colocasiae TaxID=1848973 RepID=A0ABS7PVT3_9SPHN|nr:EAL domain-containing protein [Sphingomonas colocasiae]MBY8824745.1 EAL domain-containing protein [Sphingomonas colocasiae]